jgi:hypothetical protein
MLLLLSEVLTEDIVKKVKTSGSFGILSDEVTDISNIQQLVTFIKYFDAEMCMPQTKYINTSDLLEKSTSTSASAQAIFSSLKNLIEKNLKLDLKGVKALCSDGASVFTGRREGVAVLFRKQEQCKNMINIHCICHRLALACADAGDDLLFVKDFELTLTQLWDFFKKSPKRLKIYVKVAMNFRSFDTLSKRKSCLKLVKSWSVCLKLVKSLKRAVRTRWLSLHASVDSLFEEYVGMIHALRFMKDNPAVGGATAAGLLKKIDSVKFLGVLYMLKYMLPHLSALSKTFQTGTLNFSRMVPSIEKTKHKIQEVADKKKTIWSS